MRLVPHRASFPFPFLFQFLSVYLSPKRNSVLHQIQPTNDCFTWYVHMMFYCAFQMVTNFYDWSAHYPRASVTCRIQDITHIMLPFVLKHHHSLDRNCMVSPSRVAFALLRDSGLPVATYSNRWRSGWCILPAPKIRLMHAITQDDWPSQNHERDFTQMLAATDNDTRR